MATELTYNPRDKGDKEWKGAIASMQSFCGVEEGQEGADSDYPKPIEDAQAHKRAADELEKQGSPKVGYNDPKIQRELDQLERSKKGKVT